MSFRLRKRDRREQRSSGSFPKGLVCHSRADSRGIIADLRAAPWPGLSPRSRETVDILEHFYVQLMTMICNLRPRRAVNRTENRETNQRDSRYQNTTIDVILPIITRVPHLLDASHPDISGAAWSTHGVRQSRIHAIQPNLIFRPLIWLQVHGKRHIARQIVAP